MKKSKQSKARERAIYKELGPKRKRGIPFAPWYNWNCKNWGTKWNTNVADVTQVSDTKVIFSFDTAWSPPLPVVVKLATMFKRNTLILEYAEPGSNYQGTLTIRKGKITKHREGKYKGYGEDE